MATIVSAKPVIEPIWCSNNLNNAESALVGDSEIKVDVWVCDPKTQEMFLACQMLDVTEAFDWCSELLKHDGRAGCLMIPSGKTMPSHFKVDANAQ